MSTTTVCIVDSLFLSWRRTQSEFAPDSCLRIPFTEISMFPFYGWGGFKIRLARRRAHPCDEQIAAAICSFCLYMQVKVSDSILWGGSAVETWPQLYYGHGSAESGITDGATKVGGGGDPA